MAYVTGEERDWLGNTAPEEGAMIVGARYTLTVAPVYRNETEGVYEFEWEFGASKWPDEIRWVITADAPVSVRAVGYGGVAIPMTAKAWSHLLEGAAYQCALAAGVQLQREAKRSQQRFELAYPDRGTWPEPDWDGYSPAERSFRSLVVAREREEWCAAAAHFLADADRHEQRHG